MVHWTMGKGRFRKQRLSSLTNDRSRYRIVFEPPCSECMDDDVSGRLAKQSLISHSIGSKGRPTWIIQRILPVSLPFQLLQPPDPVRGGRVGVIRLFMNLFLNFPNGLTIHRLADEESLKVLVWAEQPCSSFIRGWSCYGFLLLFMNCGYVILGNTIHSLRQSRLLSEINSYETRITSRSYRCWWVREICSLIKVLSCRCNEPY